MRRVLILAIPTGIIAGLGSVIFYTALDLSHSFFLDFLAGYRPEGPAGETPLIGPTSTEFIRWMLLVVPVTGGLVAGWLIYSFAPEAEGHGTDAALESYHFKNALIKGRIPFIKTLASAITIGSGGSGGREGPIAQIGAAYGSIIATRLKLSVEDRRILMMSGMSAGIGSIFHAPLAGAIFAAEILYRDIDLEYELLVPSAITSVIAYCTFSLFFGFSSLFVTPEMKFLHAAEIFPYTILAVIAALAAGIYSRIFYSIRDGFIKIPIKPHFKPAIGGLLTGIVGYFIPASIYTGYGVLQQGLDGQCTIQMLLIVAAAKIFTTAFSIGSGGSGGVFGPSVVIGGAIGGAVGLILQNIWPSIVPYPEAYVIVGMAGFFASAASTPFSTVIMVSEMTGNYDLLMPAIWVSTLAFLLKSRHGIYEKQLTTRYDTPIHHSDFLLGILKRLTVHELLKRYVDRPFIPIHEDMKLAEIIKIMAGISCSIFPVTNRSGRYMGVVSAIKVRAAVVDEGLDGPTRAMDLIEYRPVIYLWESLATALTRMAAEKTDELVVLEDKNSEKVKGVMSRADILKAYDNAVYESSV